MAGKNYRDHIRLVSQEMGVDPESAAQAHQQAVEDTFTVLTLLWEYQQDERIERIRAITDFLQQVAQDDENDNRLIEMVSVLSSTALFWLTRGGQAKPQEAIDVLRRTRLHFDLDS
jgi:hypothetical protein